MPYELGDITKVQELPRSLEQLHCDMRQNHRAHNSVRKQPYVAHRGWRLPESKRGPAGMSRDVEAADITHGDAPKE